MTNIDSQNMLPIGTTLQGGKYRVERYLSSGGFGNTYVVTNTKFSETFAMKEFFMKDVCERDGHNTVSVSNPGNDESFAQQRAKFNKEAQRIRKFNSAHIVKVHDLFDENGTSYYIMDFIDGGSLSDRMKSSGAPFSEGEVSMFLPQILDGLEEVHRQGIWHLDLHPKNIMLDRSGNIVLIDFGASKQLNPDNRFSASSAFCFHQGYAPPEQLDQNMAKIGAWTDLYALGATLYNLLTQLPPLSTSEIQDGEELSFPRPVSEKMHRLISWLMQPGRKSRPQSVEEVRKYLAQAGPAGSEDTETIVAKETVTPQPSPRPNPSPGPMPEPKKKPVGAIVASLAGILLCIGIGITLGRGCKGADHTDSLYTDSIETHAESIDQPSTSDISTQMFTANGVSFTMVRVDGGTFTMGATAEQGSDVDSDEKPAHQVTLSSYYIGETEVTQALWEAVMGSLPSSISSSRYDIKGPQRPICYVSWDDCQTFIRKLNEMTGQSFRLPTEAEWEYAARGGSKSRGYKYSGSNTLDEVGWYYENSGNSRLDDSNWDSDMLSSNGCCTHPVKQKKSNELGLYDMSGNVWEWCQDCYGDYPSGSQTNPIGPSSGDTRVYRGGCWFLNASCCRVSCRNYNSPNYRDDNLGLRLAL